MAGCYLTEHHPKTEIFADCFPGSISFSDMDRIVERHGRALVLEWKGAGGHLLKSQEIMWGNLTRGKMLTAIVVNGDAKNMVVSSYRLCWGGQWGDWLDSNLDGLRSRIKSWAEWAESNPVLSVSINGDVT